MMEMCYSIAGIRTNEDIKCLSFHHIKTNATLIMIEIVKRHVFIELGARGFVLVTPFLLSFRQHFR